MPARKKSDTDSKILKEKETNIVPGVKSLEIKQEAGCCCFNKTFVKRKLPFLIVFIFLLIGLGYFFRDRFLAAIVNGRPIFRYTLSEKLVSTLGKETLENLIVDQLIKEEALKNKIIITEKELDKEVGGISKSLGEGMKLEDALSMQGMTLADFRNQLKTRLQVYKILEKDISIAEEEIDQFIKDNRETLTATAEADRRTEAKQILKNQKISDKIQTWIPDLLSKAKITRFLK